MRFAPIPQRTNQHGFNFQETPPEQSIHESSIIDDDYHSTTSTATAFKGTSQPSRGPGQQYPNGQPAQKKGFNARRSSSSSQIPRPPTSSGSSSGSVGREQSRNGVRPKLGTPATATNFGQSASAVDKLRVRLVMDDAEVNATLDLGAAGEIFFLSLKGYVKKMQRKLERTVHYIRFANDKAAGAACCVVSLKEDEVDEEWEDAVKWIKWNKEKAPHGGLFGMIEQDDGD